MGNTVLLQMQEWDHEQIVYFQNKDLGLKAIVAIHNTVLGPALGGTRMYPYKNEDEALHDVLRLSRGMTDKAAAAGLNLGGGKAVIIGDPKTDKSQALFASYGRFINTLGGRFITAEDVGIDINDVEFMYKETDFVVGIGRSHGGSGDPSPFTALGVFQGMQACLKRSCGKESLHGRTVVVQGVGNVGRNLVGLLVEAGATVIVSDVDVERVAQVKQEFNVQTVAPEASMTTACDIFAPCALGAVINADTVGRLQCKIIAGAANNQLDVAERGDELKRRGILYAPDYVINAGGLMNVYLELEGYSKTRAERMTRGIYYNLMDVFTIAERDNISTAAAASRLVGERLGQARASSIYSPRDKDVLRMIHHRRARD